MVDYFNMGGHAAWIWPSYALVAIGVVGVAGVAAPVLLDRIRVRAGLEQWSITAIDAAHIGGEDVPDLVLVEDAREARVVVGHVDPPAGYDDPRLSLQD